MASDEDMGVTMLVSMWTMMGVAFLLLGLRFFCKKWYGKTTGADDYVLACSWVRNLHVNPASRSDANGAGFWCDLFRANNKGGEIGARKAYDGDSTDANPGNDEVHMVQQPFHHSCNIGQ